MSETIRQESNGGNASDAFTAPAPIQAWEKANGERRCTVSNSSDPRWELPGESLNGPPVGDGLPNSNFLSGPEMWVGEVVAGSSEEVQSYLTPVSPENSMST